MTSATHFKTAQYIADLLENRFKVLGIRFGLDPILGLFPGFGDVLAFLFSLYIIWIAQLYKVPSEVISKMISNIVIDLIVGIIPFFGDISDFFIKSNTKNMQLLRQYVRDDTKDAEVVSAGK